LAFVFVGWAAGQAHVFHVDWSNFRQSDALVFLGAYAQLVLAAAVFFQIRTADQALVRQAEGDERRSRTEKADALVKLVATAANARSLYVAAIPALRHVTYNHGSEAALDRADADLAPAEQLRQEAHAARFRVEALFVGDESILGNARRLTSSLDTQRQRAPTVLAWSRSPAGARPTPDPQDAAQFVDDEQAALLGAASDLVGPEKR
jgi:hypothetical protein